MRVGLIDVDSHNFPNLCLMKISAFHKRNGDIVEWYSQAGKYDIVYMSKVFSDVYTRPVAEPENADIVIKGGTGYAISLVNGKEVFDSSKNNPLPDEIEHIYPDYSLYPQYTGWGDKPKKQTAFGFLTRGCPRGCDFCIVAKKEGRCSRKVDDLSAFWNGQGNICLSDPNLLACKESGALLEQLIASKARIDFNQGLDARLITPDLANLLALMDVKCCHFAMDNMRDMIAVSRGLKLYVEAYKRIHGKWNYRKAKVFCLTNFDTTHEQDMERVKLIEQCECVPFIMVYNRPSAPSVTKRLQRYVDNPQAYHAFSNFYDFQRAFYKKVLYE